MSLKRNADEILDAVESGAQRIKRSLGRRQRDQAQGIRDRNRAVQDRDRELGDAQTPPKKPRTQKYPPTGTPNSKGYDANGNRLSYANNRPSYGPTQVRDVFNNTHNNQVTNPPAGLDPPGPNQIYTQNVDGTWDLVTWRHGDARRGVWDMGHTQSSKYSDLHDLYMNGDISKDEFLTEYREPSNYFAEGSARNQSHMDE